MRPQATPTQDNKHDTGRHTDLLYALNRAAASIQQSARSEESVFHAFQEQTGGLGLRGGISLLDETGERLLTRNVVFPETILPKLEAFIGLKEGRFAFDVSRVDIYRQVVETGEALFLSDSRTVLTQFFPKPMQPVADRIAKVLGTPPLIVAPLKVEGQVCGTLSVAGDDLSAEDVPAVEAFAHHISVALENARLFAALHESEKKYRMVVENAGETILVAQDGMIKFVNPKAQQIVGYSKGEMESRPFLEFVHPDDRTVLRERYEKRLHGAPLSDAYVFRVIDKQGNVHWVEARGTTIEWQERPAVLNVLNDITARKRVEQLVRTQRDMALAFSAAHGLEDGLRICVEAAIRTSEMDCGGVYLVDDSSGSLDLVFHIGLPPDFVKSASHFDADSANARLVMAGQPIYTRHQSLDVPLDKVRRREELRAAAIVPVRHEGQVIGCLNIASHTYDEVPQAARFVLETIAAQIGSGFAHLKAKAAVQRSVEQRAQLLEVARWIQSTLELDEVVRRIFESLHEVLSYDLCGIYWVDWEAKLLRPYMILGPDQWSKPLDSWPIPLGQGISGAVAEAGQAECINNAHLDPRATYPPDVDAFRDHLISIPVRTQDRTNAVFNVSRHSDQLFTQEEFELVQLFVAQASAAIENARLFEAAQQRAAQLAALNRVASTASASLDLDHILQTAVDTILDITGMESGGVSFWDERQNVMKVAVAQNVPPAIVASYNGPLRPHGLRHHILTSEQAVFMEDFSTDERATPLAHSQGFRSAALVPLRSRDKVLGLLVIGGESSHPWTPEEKELLTNIADQLAMAIENARLYEETRKQAEQVQQILDTAPEGIILLDTDYRIELANPTAWEVMPLLTGGDSAGDSLTRLGDRPIAELLATDPEGMLHEITIPGSPPRIFELAANPLKVEGQAGGWVLLCREVTEERAVQERIQQHERLAAVGQLAAGIAHDFNNLLQGIIGFSDLLQRRPNQDDTTREGLTVINTQGQRAAALIRQILDFSRRSVVDRHPFDLLSLAKETTKLLERTLPENINILTACHGHSFMVDADVAQLQQVFTNLAVNARDAMPEGGTLRFKLSRRTFKHDDPRPLPEMPAGQWVSLAVSDSGTGMSEEVLSHIFEPFFTTKEVGQGSGLGLAQVYGIVRQHDGYIGAESKPGHGTTFTIYLPEWVEGEGTEPSPEQAGLTSGGGELILLVDDNAMVREVGEAMLENLGYRVITAQNGLDALAIYGQRHHEIALVLSDMVMPAMGGTELAQRLQEIAPRAKVVLMSGYPLGETGGKRSGTGVTAWIQKPLSLDRLAETVERSLK